MKKYCYSILLSLLVAMLLSFSFVQAEVASNDVKLEEDLLVSSSDNRDLLWNHTVDQPFTDSEGNMIREGFALHPYDENRHSTFAKFNIF